jgi:histidinol-phosphatase
MHHVLNAQLPKALSVAQQAAYAAAAIIKEHYQKNLTVTLKADASPVTAVDIACEEAIKNILLAAFPEFGFYGEETAEQDLDASVVWLVDPIDGTKSFIRGYPFFSTQIALWSGGKSVLGVSLASEFGHGELACAYHGGSATLNEKPIQVSTITAWSQATLSLGNLKSLAQHPAWANLAKLVATAYRVRGYGDFYHYHLLAAGKIEVVIESDLNILDIAALSAIVEAAGGVVSDLQGKPLTWQSRNILAANNKTLHAQVLATLNYD